jgi:hypothetical protein
VKTIEKIQTTALLQLAKTQVRPNYVIGQLTFDYQMVNSNLWRFADMDSSTTQAALRY